LDVVCWSRFFFLGHLSSLALLTLNTSNTDQQVEFYQNKWWMVPQSPPGWYELWPQMGGSLIYTFHFSDWAETILV